MTQYPNDPGKDNQMPMDTCPTKTYEILTSDIFAAAMEVQTRYSYECSKQLMEKSISYTKTVFEEIERRIINMNTNIHDDIDLMADSIEMCNASIVALKDDVTELYRRTDNIRTEINAHLTDHERCVLLAGVYDLA